MSIFLANKDPNNRFEWPNVFLLIDADVFQSVQDADDDIYKQRDKNIEAPWIKVVNAAHDIEQHVPDQMELFKVVLVFSLYEFFLATQDMDYPV